MGRGATHGKIRARFSRPLAGLLPLSSGVSVAQEADEDQPPCRPLEAPGCSQTSTESRTGKEQRRDQSDKPICSGPSKQEQESEIVRSTTAAQQKSMQRPNELATD